MPTAPRVAPPLISTMVRELEEYRAGKGVAGKVAWKVNAAGDYVVAIIVPKEATVMVR